MRRIPKGTMVTEIPVVRTVDAYYIPFVTQWRKMMETNVINSQDFLNRAMVGLQYQEDVPETLKRLISDLYTIRQKASPEEWKQIVQLECRQHPIMELLHQDPLTWRAFHKPRGYAGDAVMLDFVYAVEDRETFPAIENNPPLGQAIYTCVAHSDASRGVRARRQVIVKKITTLAEQKSQPHILSLACGHLREAGQCSALRNGQLGRYVAIDQDRESLKVVEREYAALGVETVAASVRDLLSNRVTFAHFDFVYAAGLYDYLSLPVAQRLTELLFAMLNPGGRLLVANFIPGINMVAFMEAYMDWWLIYRNRLDMLAVADSIPVEQVDNYSIFLEENQNIAFLEIMKKK